MEHVIVFNLGNRDLYFKEPTEVLGEVFTDIITNKERFREISQHILENYQTYKNKISFPIVEKTLKRIKKRRDKVKTNEIVLFASDQENIHKTDTIYIAKILQNYLMDLKQTSQWKELLNELKKPLIRVTRQNPSDFDVMNEFYEMELRRLANNWDVVDQVFISITSGTPAMNTMLLLNGMKHLGNKAEILYLLKNSNIPLQLQIGKILVKQNYIDTLKENIENYDYYAALKIVQNHMEEFEERSIAQNIEQLLQYAHARVSFDFDKAEESIQQVWDNSLQTRGVVEELYNQIYELIDLSDDYVDRMMSELYWNIWMLYQRGQFIDVTGRVFRFHEESLKIILKNKLRIPLKEKGKYVSSSWLQKQGDLLGFLGNYKGKEIELNRPLTRFSMEAIITFYAQRGKQELQTVLDTSGTLDKLGLLRNQLILAHGWKGCSEQDIYNHVHEELGVNDISDLEKEFFKMLQVQLLVMFDNEELIMKNIYQEINKVLLQLITDLK